MYTYLDIPKWNELVLESLAAKANDCSTHAASASEGDVLAGRAREGDKLASVEEGCVLAEEGGATRASVGGNLAAEDGGEIAAEKGGGISRDLQEKKWNNLAAEKSERSSFINWTYYYHKIHNQHADTDTEEENETSSSDDEGELKARWAQGA
jgi:hypothetical protein